MAGEILPTAPPQPRPSPAPAPPQVRAGTAPRPGRSPEAPRPWWRWGHGGCGAAAVAPAPAAPSRLLRLAHRRGSAAAAGRRAALHLLPAGKRGGVGSRGSSVIGGRAASGGVVHGVGGVPAVPTASRARRQGWGSGGFPLPMVCRGSPRVAVSARPRAGTGTGSRRDRGGGRPGSWGEGADSLWRSWGAEGQRSPARPGKGLTGAVPLAGACDRPAPSRAAASTDGPGGQSRWPGRSRWRRAPVRSGVRTQRGLPGQAGGDCGRDPCPALSWQRVPSACPKPVAVVALLVTSSSHPRCLTQLRTGDCSCTGLRSLVVVGVDCVYQSNCTQCTTAFV